MLNSDIIPGLNLGLSKLIYPAYDNSVKDQYTNVLLIHNDVISYQTLVDSANSETFTIVYSQYCESAELVALLRDVFTTIHRIGFCFTILPDRPPIFLDKTELFRQPDELPPYSPNVQLLIDIITEFNVQHVDYLACNTLQYSHWKWYYDIIIQNTSATIGASDDLTGNIKYGGDWVMESTQENIEQIYFTEIIEYYKYLLDTLTWATPPGAFQGAIQILYYNGYFYVGFNYTNTHGYNGAVGRINASNPTDMQMPFGSASGYGSSGLYSISGPWGLAASGDYIYVGSNNSGQIARISITNPTTDYTAGWATNTQGLTNIGGMTIVGSYLYVCCGTGNKVSRVNISNPSAADTNGSWATNATNGIVSPSAVCHLNGYLYVVCNDTTPFITKISITNPSTDKIVRWTNCAYSLVGIATDGTYIYTSNQSGARIARFAVSNPTIQNLNFATTSTNPAGLTINLPYLYVAQLSSSTIAEFQIAVIAQPVIAQPVPCFKHDTKILTKKGYIPIQKLRKGDYIYTYKHHYKRIDMIGKRMFSHPATNERIKHQLYKCSRSNCRDVMGDLVITGCHCVLVDGLRDETQVRDVIRVMEHIYTTDDKYRLPACVDPRFQVYEHAGEYMIYHIALENDDYYGNYGIYANGLLVETCSQRYIKELSGMDLL
jgi:hypothetical protein